MRPPFYRRRLRTERVACSRSFETGGAGGGRGGRKESWQPERGQKGEQARQQLPARRRQRKARLSPAARPAALGGPGAGAAAMMFLNRTLSYFRSAKRREKRRRRPRPRSGWDPDCYLTVKGGRARSDAQYIFALFRAQPEGPRLDLVESAVSRTQDCAFRTRVCKASEAASLERYCIAIAEIDLPAQYGPPAPPQPLRPASRAAGWEPSEVARLHRSILGITVPQTARSTRVIRLAPWEGGAWPREVRLRASPPCAGGRIRPRLRGQPLSPTVLYHFVPSPEPDAGADGAAGAGPAGPAAGPAGPAGPRSRRRPRRASGGATSRARSARPASRPPRRRSSAT